jgi:hypothetical protein
MVRLPVALVAAALLSVAVAPLTAFADKIYINAQYPVRGPNGPTLSPPVIAAVNECSTHVYVESFVPHATVNVTLNGTIVVGHATPEFAFAAIRMRRRLHFGDKLTAVQQVNGLLSAPSAPAVIGHMPSTLPQPYVDPNIYVCGRIVPVDALVPGVAVRITDVTAINGLGSGFTPNDWSSTWDPVRTVPLTAGHEVVATQSACGTEKSDPSATTTVLPEPMPLQPPRVEPAIVGNDAITVDGLYDGALLQAFDHAAPIGSGVVTASSNSLHVAPPLQAASLVTVRQSLCHRSPLSPPRTPTRRLAAPVLDSPICPGQPAADVRGSTIDATLVLLKNGIVAGYGGAAPGDVPLSIAPPYHFARGDNVKVVEYINATTSRPSNVVKVGCTSVTTYHVDSLRTGWNRTENILTPARVASPSFGLMHSVPLDDQVDAQPLVVANQPIAGSGVHTVVYVATEGDTIYAVDASTGQILLHSNFGTPVPQSSLPGACNNNGPNIGINSTPVIDLASRTLYAILYTYEDNAPVARIHAFALSDLSDQVPPVTVKASQTLTDGTSYSYLPHDSRQRPALLEADGYIYAGFGSFCDIEANFSRGWLLGWESGSLTPLAANQLDARNATAPHSFFLSSIWMSGYGVAADPTGKLYFATGNSDYSGSTYDGVHNIQESVVKMSPDLKSVLSLFTPSGAQFGVGTLDGQDNDFGSGGVLLLPDQPGALPHLAVALGKVGQLYLLNRDNLGGYNPNGPNNVIGTYDAGSCWCGQSYFRGSDGVGRVVTSGGSRAIVWKVRTAPSTALTKEAASPNLPASGQDPGFFTSISSNGTQAGSAIVWAISRPANANPANISLFAFNATPKRASLPQLFSGFAGTWPNVGGNADIVPVVANGHVYVASYKRLSIFGLRTAKVPATPSTAAPPEALATPASAGTRVYGTIESVEGQRLTLQLRSGKSLAVDLSQALRTSSAVPPVVGKTVRVTGTFDRATAVLRADSMLHAKPSPELWEPDYLEKR